MKFKVIAGNNLPMRLPLWPSCIIYLLLDRFQPPSWVWGATITLMALVWIICIYAIWNQESVDILKGK